MNKHLNFFYLQNNYRIVQVMISTKIILFEQFARYNVHLLSYPTVLLLSQKTPLSSLASQAQPFRTLYSINAFTLPISAPMLPTHRRCSGPRTLDSYQATTLPSSAPTLPTHLRCRGPRTMDSCQATTLPPSAPTLPRAPNSG